MYMYESNRKRKAEENKKSDNICDLSAADVTKSADGTKSSMSPTVIRKLKCLRGKSY